MSLKNQEWGQIQSIQMSVQTADLYILNKIQSEQISLSCTLLTIARGKCNVDIKQQQGAVEQPSLNDHNGGFMGSLIIPRDRPVMQCEGYMSPRNFKLLNEKFMSKRSVGRPISLNIFLKEKLSVSVNGDLFIEDTREILIDYIDFVFPLR